MRVWTKRTAEWFENNIGNLLIVLSVVVTGGMTLTIIRNTGSISRGLLFLSVSFALWLSLNTKVFAPAIRSIDRKLESTRNWPGRILLAGGECAVLVVVLWLCSLTGLIGARLGGATFSSGICYYFTSFTWAHLAVGIGVLLPFPAVAEIWHVVRLLSHRPRRTSAAQSL